MILHTLTNIQHNCTMKPRHASGGIRSAFGRSTGALIKGWFVPCTGFFRTRVVITGFGTLEVSCDATDGTETARCGSLSVGGVFSCTSVVRFVCGIIVFVYFPMSPTSVWECSMEHTPYGKSLAHYFYVILLSEAHHGEPRLSASYLPNLLSSH